MQLVMVMFLKPPFDSVPNLMRPIGRRPGGYSIALEGAVEQRAVVVGPGHIAVRNRDVLSGARVAQRVANSSGQMASSNGELTVQFETCTLRQQSMSMPSRLVSICSLSISRLSTPVSSIAKCPPASIEKSRKVTLRQFFSAIALLPTPGLSASGRLARVAAAEAFAPDAAGAVDADVVQVFAPDQAVAPVIVAEVLILLPWLRRAGGIVAAGRRAVRRHVGGKDRCPGVEIERHLALQANRITEIRSGREVHRAASASRIDSMPR